MSETQSTVDWITDKKVDWMVTRIEEWIAIRERYVEGNPSMADVGHSALLRRLLSGHSALEYPPPRSFSYPNYRVAEGHDYEPMEVWFQDVSRRGTLTMREILSSDYLPETVGIDQARWDVISRDGNTFIVKWPDSPIRYSLHITLTTPTKDAYWTLQRLSE